MAILELFLGAVVFTIGYNIYRTKKVQDRLLLLESQNSNLTEALVLPPVEEGDDYKAHHWKLTGIETVHVNAFTMDRVVFETQKCTQCGMIHRFASQGLVLASKKKLLESEGFYLNGIKVADIGCKK